MTELIVARAGNIKNPRNSMPGKTALSSELAKEKQHYHWICNSNIFHLKNSNMKPYPGDASNIHQKIPMVAKSRVVERLCHEIGMLLIRLYMGNGKLPPAKSGGVRRCASSLTYILGFVPSALPPRCPRKP